MSTPNSKAAMTHSTPSFSCSCCETKQEHRAVLLPLKQVTAPYQDALLCDVCIETCNEILEEEGITTDAVPFARPARAHAAPCTPRRTYSCSFCGREEAQVMRLIALCNGLFICNLCVGACNTSIAERSKERTQVAMDGQTGDAVELSSSPQPVTILHELDLGQHTLFVMSNGSIDLIANDEQTVYLADNALRLQSDEAYRLFVALYEQFKGKQAHLYKKKGTTIYD